MTLCVVLQDENILLGMKKKGLGTGRWNGFGGKVEINETVEQAALRELREEAGIHAIEMEKSGVLNFEFQNDPAKLLEVHVFCVKKFEGEPQESNEMKPQWFAVNAIPYEQMWSDDVYWLPLLLRGEKFEGKFLFDRPSDAEYSAKIISQELKVV